MATNFWIDLPAVTVTASGSTTVLQGTSPWIDNITQFGSNNVVTGTGPSGLGIPRVTVSNDSVITALQGTSPWVVSGTVTTSPNVNVHDGTGVSISSTGSSLNVDVTNTVPVTGTFFQAIQPVSGTVTALQGTSPWVVSGTVTALQGTSPWVISGTVSTTLSNDTNYGTVGANTLRTAAQIGNATGAASFGAGTTSAQTLRVVLPTDQTAIPVTQSTSPWVVSGTVTANAGTGNFTVVQSSGANLHVNVDNFPADADALAQGSTTSGQLGALVMGAVTTAAPTYTTAQTNPLSLTTSGLLRVDGSGVTQPISGTVTANIGTTGGLALDTSLATINANLTNGNNLVNLTKVGGAAIALGQTTMASSVPVVLASNQTTVNSVVDPAGVDQKQKTSGNVASASTTTPLGANGVFTSPVISSDSWNGLEIASYSVNSPGVITVQWWNDAGGTQFLGTNSYNGNPNGFVAAHLQLPISAPFFTIVYTNGATPQTTFNFTTKLIIYLSQSDTVDLFQTSGVTNSAQTVRTFSTGRVYEVRNRTFATNNIENASVTTTIRTVTAGKIFYLTGLIVSILNSGTAARTAIEDNATVKIPITISNTPVGVANSATQMTMNFGDNPMAFATSVRWVLIAGGTLVGDITIVGYEE